MLTLTKSGIFRERKSQMLQEVRVTKAIPSYIKKLIDGMGVPQQHI